MPTIFDNIASAFLENAAHHRMPDGLKVARCVCLGYFIRRSEEVVETWQNNSSALRRLLFAMQCFSAKTDA